MFTRSNSINSCKQSILKAGGSCNRPGMCCEPLGANGAPARCGWKQGAMLAPPRAAGAGSNAPGLFTSAAWQRPGQAPRAKPKTGTKVLLKRNFHSAAVGFVRA